MRSPLAWVTRWTDYLLPGSMYRRSGAVILLAAITGPVWKVILVPLPGVSLTVGRAIILLAALLLVLDVRRAAPPRPTVPREVWLLVLGLTALGAWIVASASIWGCGCANEVAGYTEIAAVAALAAFVATFEPRLGPWMALAVLIGATSSALLALGGLQGLTEGAENQATVQGRVAGPYGNPNSLAFALAFGIPVALIGFRLYGGLVRIVFGAAAALTVLALILSFSRGGLLAMAVGASVVLVLSQPARSRARRSTVLALMAVAALGALSYPLFVDSRRDATTGVDPTLRAQDVNGWDARQQGLVPAGPAGMVNPTPGVLEVRPDRVGQGVSRAVGRAILGRAYELRFEARSRGATTQGLRFGLQDNIRANGPEIGHAQLSTDWRPLSVEWRPTGNSPDARAYLWADSTNAAFQLRKIEISRAQPGNAPTTLSLGANLGGSVFDQLQGARGEKKEARDIASRSAGLDLALEAFAAKPIYGIGWGDFPEYADDRAGFGPLPTHNEYLRFLAELGLVGAALLAALVLTIALALRRRRRDPLGLALLGIMVIGAVGMLFLNGLVASSIAMPLAIAAAASCARAARPSTGALEGVPPWPSERASAATIEPAHVYGMRVFGTLIARLQALAPSIRRSDGLDACRVAIAHLRASEPAARSVAESASVPPRVARAVAVLPALPDTVRGGAPPSARLAPWEWDATGAVGVSWRRLRRGRARIWRLMVGVSPRAGVETVRDGAPVAAPLGLVISARSYATGVRSAAPAGRALAGSQAPGIKPLAVVRVAPPFSGLDLPFRLSHGGLSSRLHDVAPDPGAPVHVGRGGAAQLHVLRSLAPPRGALTLRRE